MIVSSPWVGWLVEQAWGKVKDDGVFVFHLEIYELVLDTLWY
jgi:hypothetical protein